MKKLYFATCLFVSTTSLAVQIQASPLGLRQCVVRANPSNNRPTDTTVKMVPDSTAKYTMIINNGKAIRTGMSETRVFEKDAIQLTLGILNMSSSDVDSMSVIENAGIEPEMKFFVFWSSQDRLKSTALLIDGAFGGECN